ncbi:gluconate 2-dehydrogenase subunit 3 family protein [Croceivirga thetidis]|uniref:Gluconate 2-dehydrogenase subunit 3 family protein n=1 Tax=Croceivirga thetidis TaxID=2721623 RepID=A0ABX1GVL0_9FLAO|nr:gluconate 2-dehydrogenase subunit 3 family protein [Croceivirga thetidis]NKI33025.1 gluconate 2-dehydrogenase subunit 3 family protein [Croceivirga thetidis]
MDRRKALKYSGNLAAIAITAPSLLSLLQSCNQVHRPDWQPEFLTSGEAEFLSNFVDTILPKTDTPGALDVKADIFLDKVFAHLYDAEGQENLRSEILRFNQKCQSNFGKDFSQLSTSDKNQFLRSEEENSGQFGRGVWGTPVGPQEEIGFYRSLKSMTLWAYLSSKEIGENVLNYDPIPGAYDGCVPLKEIGRKWSL